MLDQLVGFGLSLRRSGILFLFLVLLVIVLLLALGLLNLSSYSSLSLLFLFLFSILLLLVLGLLLVQDNLVLHFIQVHQWSREHISVQEVKFFAFLEGEGDVFGFQIGVYDLADAVHVVERHEQLLGHLSHDWHGDATVVVLPHEG